MPKDITSLRQLTSHARVGATFRCSIDNGKTWIYVKIIHDGLETFDGIRGLVRGYRAAAEVIEVNMHSYFDLTDQRFTSGMIVRKANRQEVHGKVWSYE
jgi:hypothetical protein